MKNLIFINGTMGAGKSSVCAELLKILPNAVYLDGDWCWNMHPFIVTDETKAMVVRNIAHLLQSFLNCSEFKNVIFCWVMHEQAIIDSILARLNLDSANYRLFTLFLSESALQNRLQKDIAAGKRAPDILERSCARLAMYQHAPGTKIDVSEIDARTAAEQIATQIPPFESGVQIIPITPENASLASQIYARAWKNAYRGIVPDAYLNALSLERWSPILARSKYEGYLMLESGTPVATSSITPARDAAMVGWGEIVSLYVAPGVYRKGFGKALMKHDLNRLRELGFTRACLWVLKDNARARAFYASMGFQPNGDEISCEIGGKSVCEVRYTRTL